MAETQAIPMNTLHEEFGLTLMVNHACNLRCSYCYTGAKFSSPMAWKTGEAAIGRALHSLAPGGRLGLGFFGGEPLLEAGRILEWMAFARAETAKTGKRVCFHLTTNGTITSAEAWQAMLADDLILAVSCDGSPRMHNRHRRDAQGGGSAAQVEATLRRLVGSEMFFTVVFVVRPDNLDEVPEGLKYLHALGVRQVDLSLDLWTTWSAGDGERLQQLIQRAAELWRGWLPDFGLSWFDSKAGALARVPVEEASTRCGFGSGEIAVAPSGNLYPCERLIGEDAPGQPMRLPGHVLEGSDFLTQAPATIARHEACTQCALLTACDTTCRCSNFVRTGDQNRPDGLLCLLNKATAVAAAKVLANGAIA